MNDLWTKLENVSARCRDLEGRLADPAVLKNPELLKKLSREHSELRELVETYETYKKLGEEIREHQSVLEEGDPELVPLATEELAGLERHHGALAEALKKLLVPKDPFEGKNIILEIRAGTGGDEAALFARDLFDMYLRYADQKGWKVEILSHHPTGKGGYKEVIARIEGKAVYGRLRFESGVHRVQRVPETEAQGRVHTSAATVAVLPEAEDAEVEVDEKDLKIDVYRSSGPGGQGVNTTDSAVRITHLPTGMVVVCQDERSQHKNKAKAMKILKSRLLEMERERQEQERVSLRRSQVRSGDRSEKIRTYNFPQNRVTDHRIGLTIHQLDRVLEGELDPFVEALRANHQAETLANEVAPDQPESRP
jgi:peptide chain release factor 1